MATVKLSIPAAMGWNLEDNSLRTLAIQIDQGQNNEVLNVQQPLDGEERLMVENIRSLAHEIARIKSSLGTGPWRQQKVSGPEDAQLSVAGLGVEGPPLHRRGVLLKGSAVFSSPKSQPKPGGMN